MTTHTNCFFEKVRINFKMKSFFLFFLGLLISCNQAHHLKMDKLKKTRQLVGDTVIYNSQGFKIIERLCLGDCKTDSALIDEYIYNNAGKLSSVKKFKNDSFSISIPMCYSGNNEEVKYLAGHYLFNSYFNNRLVSPSGNSLAYFNNLLVKSKSKNLFVKFLDSSMFSMFRYHLDSLEAENLYNYIRLNIGD